MSSQPNPQSQTEPTMEEILASIRKIISEDQPAEASKPAARPTVVKAPSPPTASVSALAPAPGGDLDVLELTDEIPDEEPAEMLKPLAAAPAPALENDVIFQAIEPAPKVKEAPMDDDLISEPTRHAMGQAFANLNGQSPPQVALKSGTVEAVFADAVQQAFRPVLKEWIDEHSSDVMDQLRPLIRAWMDEHLPPLIETAVVKEIVRAADRARRS